MMRRIGCGDDDQVDGPSEELIDAADEFDIRIARVWRAPALNDGSESETLDRANDGGVEYFAREAKTDEADVQRHVNSLSKYGQGAAALVASPLPIHAYLAAHRLPQR